MTRHLGPCMRKIRKAGIENFGFSLEGVRKSRAVSKNCAHLEVEGIVLKRFIDNVWRKTNRT